MGKMSSRVVGFPVPQDRMAAGEEVRKLRLVVGEHTLLKRGGHRGGEGVWRVRLECLKNRPVIRTGGGRTQRVRMSAYGIRVANLNPKGGSRCMKEASESSRWVELVHGI